MMPGSVHEFNSGPSAPPDLLFTERLDAFCERQMVDVKAFAARESRSFEETQRLVAEWHSRFLFDPMSRHNAAAYNRANRVQSVLFAISQMLESLRAVTGVESFVLSVNPENPSDNGFLGGTMVGRRYWRNMRGGGEAGAKGFKTFCIRDIESYKPVVEEPPPPNSDPPKAPTAKSLKTELYDIFRKELRTVSGVPNAEMRWTNTERLDVYGVRLVGWPANIPAANPSSLKSSQNKILLDCIENGTIRFERLFRPSEDSKESPPPTDHAPLDSSSIPVDNDPPFVPFMQDTATIGDFSSRFRRILLPPEDPPLSVPGPSRIPIIDHAPPPFVPVLQDTAATQDFSWHFNVDVEERLMPPPEIMGQPVNANSLEMPDDSLWQTPPEEPKPYTDAFWAEVDVNTLFQNTYSSPSNSSPSNSRKRPRTDWEEDYIPGFP